MEKHGPRNKEEHTNKKIKKSQIIRWSTHMCTPGYDFEIKKKTKVILQLTTKDTCAHVATVVSLTKENTNKI